MTKRRWLNRILGRAGWLERSFEAGLEAYAEELGTTSDPKERADAEESRIKADRQRRTPSFA